MNTPLRHVNRRTLAHQGRLGNITPNNGLGGWPYPALAIITSVDFTTANTSSPTLSRSRSADERVMIETMSWSPTWIRTSAITPSATIDAIRPRSRLRALISSAPSCGPASPPVGGVSSSFEREKSHLCPKRVAGSCPVRARCCTRFTCRCSSVAASAAVIRSSMRSRAGGVARLQRSPDRPPRRRHERRADLQHHVGVRLERDRARVARERLSVNPRLQRLALARTRRGGNGPAERLAPHPEEVIEDERAILRRLDVDDAVGRVRVQPVDAPLRDGLPDVRRDEHRPAVVEDQQVLVDVNPLALLRVAGNAAHRFTRWRGLALHRRRNRSRPGRRGKSENARERE